MKTVHRDIAGAFILSKDGKVLLGKNDTGGVYKDCWLIPGGGVEAGETPLEAVKREVYEEVGLQVTNAMITSLDSAATGESEKVIDGEVMKVVMKYYDFRIDMSHNANDYKIEPGDGFVDACWLTSDEVRTRQLSPGVAAVLAQLGYN